tara:strand:+ start:786 stop:1607 length:822 start_codon:yes stop_codon:yes gene_type:complete
MTDNECILVSVNITTFNRSKLLKRCLDSIKAQTYKFIEIIVIDDCSSDIGYQEIIKHKDIYSNLIYKRNSTNRGNAYSRNMALELSNGELIAFLDDDDYWIDNDKISRQVDLFRKDKEEKFGICCTSVRRFYKEDLFRDQIVEEPSNLQSLILAGNGLIYSPTVMIRKELLKELNGFDESLPRGVDSDLYRRVIINRRKSIYFDPRITTAVREYGTDRMTKIDTRINIIKGMLSHLIAFRKFNIRFFIFPKSLFLRLKSLIYLIIKYISTFLK